MWNNRPNNASTQNELFDIYQVVKKELVSELRRSGINDLEMYSIDHYPILGHFGDHFADQSIKLELHFILAGHRIEGKPTDPVITLDSLIHHQQKVSDSLLRCRNWSFRSSFLKLAISDAWLNVTIVGHAIGGSFWINEEAVVTLLLARY